MTLLPRLWRDRRSLAAALRQCLLVVLLSALPAAAMAEGPALWVARDADSTLYLFGTAHALKPGTEWRTAALDAKLQSASQLILEVANPDDQAAILPVIQQYGLSPERPLSSLLTPEELQQLDAAAQSMGLSAAKLDSMRPWLAAVTLSAAPVIRAGYLPNSGADMVLRRDAMARGMTVTGFETAEEQIQVFAGFPEDGQLRYLRRVLSDYTTGAPQLDNTVEAWRKGDVAGIETFGIQPVRDTGAVVYDRVIVARNRKWVDRIDTLLAGEGIAFVAVGALHLAGPDSLIEMLKSRGVKVERIE